MTPDAADASLPFTAGVVVERRELDKLFSVLRELGNELVGPTIRDGAIVYDTLEDVGDLPVGWTDEQEAGSYRLARRRDLACFGYVVGPHSWKKYLFSPRKRLWRATRDGNGFQIHTDESTTRKLALIGVRACELAAIGIQDKVFTGGPFVAPDYQSQRQQLFVVAVNCVEAGNTCFCVSMNTGPKAKEGYDLALTEVIGDSRHYFLASVGTASGQKVLDRIDHRPATKAETLAATQRESRAASQMGRQLHTQGLKELLLAAQTHAHWDKVAERCLSCSNCTMVCPTCFCSTVEDVVDLEGQTTERVRTWDSCFNEEFSYIHGGSVRPSGAARYRQWMTHKLASWHDQFGTSGCVGCGRCITWCPVGIDITEEANALSVTVTPKEDAT